MANAIVLLYTSLIRNGRMDEVAILFCHYIRRRVGLTRTSVVKVLHFPIYLQQLRPEYLFGYPNSRIPTHISRRIVDCRSEKWHFPIRVTE
jgi:hypothetical protein